jgi:magnesium-transporting ATPase (P-type)
MDILAAIALGTEEPRTESSRDPPKRISRKEQIIDARMWRQILVMSAYQLIVMLILMFFGSLIFFENSFNLITTPIRDPVSREATDRLKLNTILFYSFILMNLFNQINCRNLDQHNINAFDKIWTNLVFIIVLILEFVVSMAMIRGGANPLVSKIIGTAAITENQHIVCWCLGFSVLVVNIIIKKIPMEPFENFESNVNLESCK